MRNPVPEDADGQDELIVQRVESLLRDMGWTPKDLAQRLHSRMGYKGPKAVEHWFMRKNSRRLSVRAVREIAELLGVDPGYLILYHDNLDGTLDPDGLYALKRQIRRLHS